MKSTHAVTLKGSLGKQGVCSTRPGSAAAPSWVKVIPGVVMLLLASGACVPRGSEPTESEAAGTDEPGGARPASSQWPRLCQADEGCDVGIVCPVGFSRVGPAGVFGSYCISQQQEPVAKFFQAMTECRTMVTSDGSSPHLCTLEEWYTACSQEEDDDQSEIDDMTNDKEWVSHLDGKTKGMAMGAGSCTKMSSENLANKSFAYRCCVS